MAGIVTNAYQYLHGEHRLQFFTMLKTPEALRDFIEDNPTGVVLYSDYVLADMAEWSEIRQEKRVLEAAATSMVLCPITAAIFDRLSLSLADCVSIEGKPFGASGHIDNGPGSGDDEFASVPFDEQPFAMQAEKDLQAILNQFPKVTGPLIAQGIHTLSIFQQFWNTLPIDVANIIGLEHYRNVCAKELLGVDRTQRISIADGLRNIAGAMPPWVNNLSVIEDMMRVRTSNALVGMGYTTFNDVAQAPSDKLANIPHAGIKSLNDLLDAMTYFYHTGLQPLSLLDGAPAKAPQSSHDSLQEKNVLPKLMLGDFPDVRDIKGVSLYDITARSLASLKEAVVTLSENESQKEKYLRALDILSRRLSGTTLEGCSTFYDVTRERIRQLETQAIKEFPVMYSALLQELKCAAKNEPDADAFQDTAAGRHVFAWKEHYKSALALGSLQAGLNAIIHDANHDYNTPSWQRLLIVNYRDLRPINTKLLYSLLALSSFNNSEAGQLGEIFPTSFLGNSGRDPRAGVPEEIVLVPLPSSAVIEEERDFVSNDLLPSLEGLTSSNAFPFILARLRARGWPTASIEVFSECTLLYWMNYNGESLEMPHVGTTAQQERAAFLELLKNTSRPLHIVDDIFLSVRPNDHEHPRPDALANHWVSSTQEQLPTTDEDFPVKIGNSMIATMRHLRMLGIADHLAKRIAQHIQQKLAKAPTREYAVTQLATSLEDEGLLEDIVWPEQWPDSLRSRLPNMLNVILYSQRPSNVRNMGRFIWKHGPWTDAPDTENRTQVYEFYQDLFRQKRRPLTAREMLHELKRQRHVAGINQSQVTERNGIIRLRGSGLSAVYWLEELGDPEHLGPFEGTREDAQEGSATRNKPDTNVLPDKAPEEKDAKHDMGDQEDIPAFLEALFHKKQRPMTAQEILKELKERYGHKAPSGVQEKSPIVKLQGRGDTALYWCQTLDPDNETQVASVQKEALIWLSRNKSLPLDQVASLLPKHQKLLLPLSEWQRGALLAQHASMNITLTHGRRLVVVKAT